MSWATVILVCHEFERKQREREAAEAARARARARAPVSESVVGACSFHFEALKQCFDRHANDIGKCQTNFDMLRECEKNSGSVFGR